MGSGNSKPTYSDEVNYGKCGEFMSYADFILSETPKPGDRIQFKRYITKLPLYYHWAIFKGEGKIIHSPGEPLASSSGICEAELKKVAGESLIRINNIYDTEKTPLNGEEIIERACGKICTGKELESTGYGVLSNNCEHFVNWARYKVFISHQADFRISPLYGRTAHPDEVKTQEEHEEEWCKNEKVLNKAHLLGAFLGPFATFFMSDEDSKALKEMPIEQGLDREFAMPRGYDD